MGVAVLQPRDCLKDHFSPETLIVPASMKRPSRKLNPDTTPNPNRSQSHRRKRSPTGAAKGGGGAFHNRSPPPKAIVVKSPAKNLVMGQVKILKRGEDVPETTSDVSKIQNHEDPVVPGTTSDVSEIQNHEDPVDLVLSSTDRLGPDPVMVQKQIRFTDLRSVPGFYAAIASPPPSSLPLPAFCSKSSDFSKNGDAASDIRRMLRLNLS